MIYGGKSRVCLEILRIGHSAGFIDDFWGFYRTYEELKHHPPPIRPTPNRRFYRTYEELKPPADDEYPAVIIAFLSYLGGIETTIDVVFTQ